LSNVKPSRAARFAGVVAHGDTPLRRPDKRAV
jgi:hypothetical protein